MLSHIEIRDYALVQHLSLELNNGMSALTGETGAGKSILIGAMGLALGDRADSDHVRAGASKAEISASFNLATQEPALQWLQAHDLDTDGDCIIRRVITREGRSRAYINGSPAPLAQLRELGERLIDIHGQHEHQRLVKKDQQRQLLDANAGLADDLTQLASHFKALHQAEQQLAQLSAAASERSQRIDMLRYQVQELEQAAPNTEEIGTLDEEHTRLSNAGQLLQTAQTAITLCYDNEQGSALSLLTQAQNELGNAAELDSNLNSALELCTQAHIQVQEASDELRRYAEQLDLDPQRLNWVEERISQLHDLSRKHRVEMEQLPEKFEELSQELQDLENCDETLAGLEDEIERLKARYDKLAQAVSLQRQQAANQLGTNITTIMQELGMPQGQLLIEVSHSDKRQRHGIDEVQLLVSANPGQPPKPLARVASGGELARISLAVQVVAAQSVTTPCMVFDEVDTGVGGGIAEIVGRQLRTLGKRCQVLCVTHLPQVAAQAHHHLQVAKQVQDHTTATTVVELNQKERTEEVARMLGGIEMTKQTLAHAKEMLQRAAAA